MKLDLEVARELVPPFPPPERFMSPRVVLERERMSEIEDWQRNAYVWATALIQAGLESTVPVPPRFCHTSAGFIAIGPNEAGGQQRRWRQVSGTAFGLYVLVRSSQRHREVQQLLVGDLWVPVVIVSGEVELHGQPPNPIGGASTCWARSTTSTHWSHGILTCRHLVSSNPIGTAVALQPSSAHASPVSAGLADKDECTIDAAILEVHSKDWPTGLAPLPVNAPVFPGQAVRFEDRSGTVHRGSVLRVFHDGRYYGNLLGQRVVADCHGRPGDSGSLLMNRAMTEGVGVYMGTIPDGVGGYDGIYQDLQQATAYFGLDLYR
jgi:hypothetical protein